MHPAGRAFYYIGEFAELSYIIKKGGGQDALASILLKFHTYDRAVLQNFLPKEGAQGRAENELFICSKAVTRRFLHWPCTPPSLLDKLFCNSIICRNPVLVNKQNLSVKTAGHENGHDRLFYLFFFGRNYMERWFLINLQKT